MPAGEQRLRRRRTKLAPVVGLLTAFFLLAVPSGLARPQDDVIAITGGPVGDTTARDATFTFAPAGRVVPAYATCQLDSGGESRCFSPVAYGGLELGAHRFTVRAYSTRGGLQGSDSRSWTIVAGQPGPQPGPQPEPQPQPPGLQARLSVPATVPPSGLAVIDASSSTGAIASLAFDLDGNGSFETKCGSVAQAGAAYGKPGSYAVGVMVTAPTGETSVAQASLAVAGSAAPLPPGAKQLPPNVSSGGCVEPGAAPLASLALYLTCPKTVIVGVAEAVALSGCFQRTTIDKPVPRELFLGSASAYARVNGITVRPEPGARVTLDTTIERIYLLDQGKASLSIFLESPFVIIESSTHALDWDVSAPSVVGPFPGSGLGDQFLGLHVGKFSTPISFTADRRGRVPIAVGLPYPFKDVATGKLTLETDNTQGPLLTSFKVAFGNVPLGIFEVKNATLAYTRQGKDDVWSGGLTLAFPPPGSVIVAKGSLGLRNGNFDQASAAFEKPTPGYGPFGCCVYMTKFGGTLKTSEIDASATLTAGPAIAGKALVSLDGTVTVSLVTLYISAKGQISVVGIPVANGNVALTANGVYFLGSIDRTFAGILEAKATIAGGLYANGSWYAAGSGGLCIDTEVKEFCAGGGVAISNKGVSGCVKIKVSVGAVVYWNGSWSIFWSCSFGVLKSKVGAASLDATRATAGPAASATDVTVRPGLARALIHLTGAGDAPRVRVEGPDGSRFEVPGPEGDYAQNASRFVLRLPKLRTTDIVLLRPAAGTWRVTPLPGSPRIVAVEQADGLPDRIVRGELSGAGHARILRFTTVLDERQRVTFVERADGVEHLIGRTTAAQGVFRFDLADGPAGRRRVDAVIEWDGIPIRTETVARFRAPGPLLLPAPAPVATRTARGLSVRWGPVRGAAAYRVRVSLGDGTTVSSLRRREQRSFTVSGLDARTSASASVWALSSSYRPGRAGRSQLAARPSVSLASTPSAHRLLRTRSLVVTCVPAADGSCSVELRVGNRVIGRGAANGAYGRPVRVQVRLTSRTTGLVVPGATLHVRAAVPGEGTRATRVRLR